MTTGPGDLSRLSASSLDDHVPALDGLRGWAVLMVMACHFVQASQVQLAEASPVLGSFASKLAIAGWRGVDLFFVLSGFLITGILLKAKTRGHYFRNFYMRRILRIFPLYYGVLFVILVPVALVEGKTWPEFQGIIKHQVWLWCYGINVPPGAHYRWFCDGFNLVHLWSLAVEEHFYVIWPVLVLLLKVRHLIALWICIISVSPFLRAVSLFHGLSYWTVYSFTPFRMDSLLCGALVAAIANVKSEWLHRWALRGLILFGCGCIMIIILRRRGDFAALLMKAIDFSITAALFACLLWVVVAASGRGAAWRHLFTNRFVRSMGKYSYGLYVLHFLFLSMFLKFFGPERLALRFHSAMLGALGFCSLAFFFSCVAAYASWNLYEKQFLKLKRLFEYETTPRQSATLGPVQPTCTKPAPTFID